MKLRTLKELIKHNKDELSFGGYTEDILRIEAKKWIKSIEDDKEKPLKFSLLTSKWIKHFFNLSDDEEIEGWEGAKDKQ